jgi:hypothetical protein
MIKFDKGYKKVFFYICDMAILNLLFCIKKSYLGKKQIYGEYRLQIAEKLLQTLLPLKKINSPEKSLFNENAEMRLEANHWAHFPKHIDPTPKKKTD